MEKINHLRQRTESMNRSPISLAIKIILGTLFLFWLLLAAKKGGAEEYAVPHSGSPYEDLDKLDENQILHIPTGVLVTKDQMLDILAGSRVIYIGETHDNLEAHRVQLEIIRRLARKYPGKLAVGMEMFRRSSQKDLDRWKRGELPDTAFKKLFHNNWGPGFKLYRPIFKFLEANSIPLIGLKVSKQLEARFRREDGHGASGVFPELDENDPYHKAYSMAVFGGHKKSSGHFLKPYRMLLLWEESMAQTVTEFLDNKDYPDWKLVVLAGGFHVQYGFGIPKRAFRRKPHAYSIVLPTVTELPEDLKDREMNVEHVFVPLYLADFAWKLQYKVLPKNRILLGVRLEDEEEGVSVTQVGEKSNAEKAGIQVGDVLLAMNGKQIAGVEDLVDRLQQYNFGDRTTFHLRRGAEELDVEVLLGKMGP
ncbi:MAG: ChaN family lipoprotein [Nitrospinaceae bacterium]